MSVSLKPQSPAQNAAPPQDSSQEKLAEQIALVRRLVASRLVMSLCFHLRLRHSTVAP